MGNRFELLRLYKRHSDRGAARVMLYVYTASFPSCVKGFKGLFKSFTQVISQQTFLYCHAKISVGKIRL